MQASEADPAPPGAGRERLVLQDRGPWVFALEAGDDASNRELLRLVRASQPLESDLRRIREIYEERGAFTKAEHLVEKYRSRAKDLAGQIQPAVMRELMNFIVDILLW